MLLVVEAEAATAADVARQHCSEVMMRRLWLGQCRQLVLLTL